MGEPWHQWLIYLEFWLIGKFLNLWCLAHYIARWDCAVVRVKMCAKGREEEKREAFNKQHLFYPGSGLLAWHSDA